MTHYVSLENLKVLTLLYLLSKIQGYRLYCMLSGKFLFCADLFYHNSIFLNLTERMDPPDAWFQVLNVLPQEFYAIEELAAFSSQLGTLKIFLNLPGLGLLALPFQMARYSSWITTVQCGWFWSLISHFSSCDFSIMALQSEEPWHTVYNSLLSENHHLFRPHLYPKF